jgi:hypothetical protein
VIHRRRDHRFLVPGPALLDKPGPDDLSHRSSSPFSRVDTHLPP